MSCRCHEPHETGGEYIPRAGTSDPEDYVCKKHGSYKNKCPALDDQAWNALTSLREKTCGMFSSESEATVTDVFAKRRYANETGLESDNILRKANDLIDYAPESEFLKKMKLQCQYLQNNQSNIFSALDEGIQDDCFEYHKPQPAQMGGPKCDSPTDDTFIKSNYDGNPRVNYADYDEMNLNPFSFELECNARNMQSQPVVEVSYVEPLIQCQQNEEKKSEHVSRSRKPFKCRRKRKSGNAGKCESENQFEPTLKKPHENSCVRCWRYASPSRSPVNKPDQKYDPNFRRGHSRTDFERGDGNLEVQESYTSPCPDSETFTKEPSPSRFPVQKSAGKFPSPPKPATAPEQYPQPLTAQFSPSPKDMQSCPRVQKSPGKFPSPSKSVNAPEQYQQPLTAQFSPSPREMQSCPRVQSISPPRPAQNYPVKTPSTFPSFGGDHTCCPNLSLPVGIPRTTAPRSPKVMEDFPAALSSSVPAAMFRSPMAQTCPDGLSSTFPVTNPPRSAAVPNYPTEPPSFLFAMPRPPSARSTSPSGMRGSPGGPTAPPTCLQGSAGIQPPSSPKIVQNYSSSQSSSPPKTIQNYSRVQSSCVPRSMQNNSDVQSALLSKTKSPTEQSPLRSLQNSSSLQVPSPSKNGQNYSGALSSSDVGSVPRPASSPRPMQNYPCAQPPPIPPVPRPPSAPTSRSTQPSPNTCQKSVQFDRSPPRATDRCVQNFNTCNQPCPTAPQGNPQGMIYTGSGRKERPKSVIPDMGSTEINRCYDGMEELDMTDYKIFTPRPKDQVYEPGSSIRSCEPTDLNETKYKTYSPRDQTYEMPVIPRPGIQTPSVENTPSSRQSPRGLESIPEGKSSSTKSPKSKSPKNTSKHSSPKTGSPSRGKGATCKSKSPERSGSGLKKGKTKSPSPKPGTSKAEVSRSPKKSPQKPGKSSPGKCSNTSGEEQRGTQERPPTAGPSKEYHCGAKTDSAKAKEWYFDSGHPLRECTCYPRVPIFTNDPDNYQGGRIFCCHCDWNKSGNQKPQPGSGEKQTPTKSGSCNCSRQKTPQTPKEFDGVAFPCPYRRSASNSQDNGKVPVEEGSEQQKVTKPSPQQQNISNPANCSPRKYVVYYMTKCKEKKRDEDEVEVLVEEFSRCPKESDSRTNDLTEKMKRIMDCPSDSMALRFQKGVSESSRTPPSSRILYF